MQIQPKFNDFLSIYNFSCFLRNGQVLDFWEPDVLPPLTYISYIYIYIYIHGAFGPLALDHSLSILHHSSLPSLYPFPKAVLLRKAHELWLSCGLAVACRCTPRFCGANWKGFCSFMLGLRWLKVASSSMQNGSRSFCVGSIYCTI